VKIIDCVQGGPEWVTARLGIPTASRFDKILTPVKMEPSKSAIPLAHDLIAERILGYCVDEELSAGMVMRGREQEEKARNFYEFQKEVEVQDVGFITLDDGSAGCSPDGLIGSDGLLEIKCPSPGNHVAYMLNAVDGIGYRCQVQGQLWIAERDWIDTVSYHPHMQAQIVRVGRQDVFIKHLRAAVATVNEYIEKQLEYLSKAGKLDRKLGDRMFV